ncbi:MAG: hypothetical protein WA892_05965 [Ornithinimicrobium sp.]
MSRESPLAGFVVRARRVAAHPLARDHEALLVLAQDSFTLTLSPGHPAKMRRTLPPEELFESLAARARPVIL